MSAGDGHVVTLAAALRHDFDTGFASAASGATVSSEDVLAIRLGADPYALRLSQVAGLHADCKLVEVPGPVRELLGIAGIRGLLVPVYDLAALLGYSRASRFRWLALAQGPHPVGLALTQYEAHLKLPRTALTERQPAAGPGGAAEYLCGSVQAGGIVRPLIHLDAVVASIEERLREPNVTATRGSK